MYYFKVPVFTKFNKTQNIIFLVLQFIILIISITVSLYRGCSYKSLEYLNGCKRFNILPGNTLVTDKTTSVWQFVTPKEYSSELISTIPKIQYSNTHNSTYNGYVLMKGNIVIFDYKLNNYISIFKEFLLPIYYNNFHNRFTEEVDMNGEKYSISINDGFLNLAFLNNCSNNLNLYEDKHYQACSFNNKTLENINKFLLNYFNEKFITEYTCSNCYIKGITTFDELISVSSKCISIFILFNSLLIIIFTFILSKIINFDIGYIDNIINQDIVIDKNKNILYIE